MEKIKTYKKTIIFTSLATLLPIVFGILLWNKLPAEIATHFNANGEPDGWSSKYFAVFGLPFFLLFVHFLAIAVTCTDPKKQHINDKVFKLILWLIPIISCFTSLSMYRYELGYSSNISTNTFFLCGIIFIFTGNYLPKCRQNYTVGIKIPWTLHDEDNWNYTHRLAGKLWILCGLLILVLNLLNLQSLWPNIIIISIMVFVPVLASFLYYIKHKQA